MARDARRAELQADVVEPVHFGEGDPLVGVSPADLLPGQLVQHHGMLLSQCITIRHRLCRIDKKVSVCYDRLSASSVREEVSNAVLLNISFGVCYD